MLDPDLAQRSAAVFSLNPARTYLWRATWANVFRLEVLDGGIGGTPTSDLSITHPKGKIYNPNPPYAYLGANNGPYGEDTGSRPGAVCRNVWISNRPRPATLGHALQ